MGLGERLGRWPSDLSLPRFIECAWWRGETAARALPVGHLLSAESGEQIIGFRPECLLDRRNTILPAPGTPFDLEDRGAAIHMQQSCQRLIRGPRRYARFGVRPRHVMKQPTAGRLTVKGNMLNIGHGG